MFFRKINCKVCGNRVNNRHRYCYFCGADLKDKNAGFRDDFDLTPVNLPFPLGKIFNQLTKELAREMDKVWEETDRNRNVKGSGLSISISNEDGVPRIKIREFGRVGELGELGELGEAEDPYAKKARENLKKAVSKEDAERYAKLPREEAQTDVKRLSDRIVYELLLPGVKDSKDIFINKLQNSIEVKAFGKDKAYFKLIPVSMRIKGYALRDEKLVLELKD